MRQAMAEWGPSPLSSSAVDVCELELGWRVVCEMGSENHTAPAIEVREFGAEDCARADRAVRMALLRARARDAVAGRR